MVFYDEQKGEPKGKGGEIESGQGWWKGQRQGQGQRKGQTPGKKKPGTYNSPGVSDLGFEQRVPEPRVKFEPRLLQEIVVVVVAVAAALGACTYVRAYVPKCVCMYACLHTRENLLSKPYPPSRNPRPCSVEGFWGSRDPKSLNPRTLSFNPLNPQSRHFPHLPKA